MKNTATKGRSYRGVSEVITTVILAATIIMISLVIFYYAMYAFQTSSLATQFGYTKSVLLDLASNLNYVISGNQYYANIPSKTVGVGYNESTTYTISIGVPAYNITITINNPLSTPLNNYQVMVWLNQTNFAGWNYLNMTGNTTDFIFVDPYYHILSFYVQEFDPLDKVAKIWVKVPYIPGGGSTKIIMFYGNPLLKGRSDFYSVFDRFYDDFTSDPYNDGKWIIYKAAGTNYTAEFVWDQKQGVVNLTLPYPDLGVMAFAAENNKPIQGLPVLAIIRYKGGNPSSTPADGFAFAFNKDISVYEQYASTYGGTGGSLDLELLSPSGTIISDGYAFVMDAYQNTGTYPDPAPNYTAIERTNVTYPYPKIDNKYYLTDAVSDLRWHVLTLSIEPDYSYANISIDGSQVLTNVALPTKLPYTGFGISASTHSLSAYYTVDYIEVYYRKYYGLDPTVYVNPVNGTGFAPIFTMNYVGIYTAAYAAFTTTKQIVYGTDNYTVNDIRLIPRVTQFYLNGFTYAELDTFRFLVNPYEVVTASGTTYAISIIGVELHTQVISSSPSQLIASYAGITYSNVFNTTRIAIIVSLNGYLRVIDITSSLTGYNPATSHVQVFVTVKKVNVVFI